MNLNDAGKMVEKWYAELENKFPNIKCHAMIVMPNHFHCIVRNTGDVSVSGDVPVGADLCVCPYYDGEHGMMDEQSHWGEHGMMDEQPHWGEHIGSPLQRVVQWFKTMSTNEYIRGVKNLGWKPFNGKLWQRNYYEHIIRNNKSYHAISEYISSPLKSA